MLSAYPAYMTTTSDSHPEIAVAELRKNVSDAINRTVYGGERVLVTKRGKPAAALISAADLEYFERLEKQADLAALREAEAKDDGYRVSSKDLRSKLGI